MHMRVRVCVCSHVINTIPTRWDMQRARTLREHHELLRKYNMKSGEKGGEKRENEKPLTTFIPDLSEGAWSLSLKSILVLTSSIRTACMLLSGEN